MADDAHVAEVKSRKRRDAFKRVLTALAGLGGLVVLWYAVVKIFGVEEYIVPSPVDVGRELVDSRDLLLSNLWPTAIEAVAGFMAGNVLAIGLAILFVHAKRAEEALFPVAVFIRTIPIVAIAPILVIIFGTGYTPKVIIAALISFFPTLVNVVRGLQAVDPQALELMRVLSASKRELFFKVRLYASLPFLFSALKIAATSSVIGALVAEWVGSEQGLGYLIIQSTYNFQTSLLYASMIVASLFATLFFASIGLIERLVVTWEVSEEP
ncbi:ABC transporter permease subunit [Janibacter cremeus]|uniref:NitT/TauT family transport system permease protein n=1 Tax=Janibacter cremeus TaxID=1285192 RepID=A0A852VUH4_9MICO|nr:NitT/TauT family transport system permease protein [Janibacter cremeus]